MEVFILVFLFLNSLICGAVLVEIKVLRHSGRSFHKHFLFEKTLPKILNCPLIPVIAEKITWENIWKIECHQKMFFFLLK